MFFKTLFEEIKTKADSENKINSNIDQRQSPVFFFYFKVPPRGLICWTIPFFKIKGRKNLNFRVPSQRYGNTWDMAETKQYPNVHDQNSDFHFYHLAKQRKIGKTNSKMIIFTTNIHHRLSLDNILFLVRLPYKNSGFIYLAFLPL